VPSAPARPVPAPYPFEYQPPRPPGSSWVWPVIGLVLVLLVACGGLAFASCEVIGSHNASTAAVASTGPAASSLDRAAPSASPAGPSASPAGPASPDGPSAVPAGSAAVPFGTAHTVIWPDHLVAYVFRARHYDLPEGQLAIHPGDISVGVEAKIVNNSPVDVVVTPATMRMWYGPDRRPADRYDGSISQTGDGFFGVVHPGHTADGWFSFAVPPRYMRQLVIEMVPRPGDAPALFAGSVD